MFCVASVNGAYFVSYSSVSQYTLTSVACVVFDKLTITYRGGDGKLLLICSRYLMMLGVRLR